MYPQQRETVLRYATEEELKEHRELDSTYDALLKEHIETYRKVQQEGKQAGFSDEKIGELFQNSADYLRINKALTATANRLLALEQALIEKYIDAIKNDIPLLFEDIDYVINFDTDISVLHFIIIDEINEKKPKSIPTLKVCKRFALQVLDNQNRAFRKSETKTEEDKARYRQLIEDFAKRLADLLTPEQQAAIHDAFKHRNDADTRLTPIQPAKTFHTPNSYMANSFHEVLKYFYKEVDGQYTFSLPNEDGMLPIDITGKSKGHVFDYFSINYEGDITKEGTNTIDYNRARIQGFDTAVLDAICTILETGQNDIYISALDALLNGRDKIQAVGKKREERILLAFRKLSGTRVKLDITNELKAKYDFAALDLKEGVLDAAMLEYTGLELTNYAGQKTYVIHVEKMPAIYQYSKAKGEIASFPTALLETGERAEERYTTLKIALLKRISLINKRIMREKKISFIGLYRAAGLKEHENATQRKRERDALINMLMYWKKQGYIKGYTSYYEGKSVAGFEIEPKYITANN